MLVGYLGEFITRQKLIQTSVDVKGKKCFIYARIMLIFHLIITAFIFRMMELLWDLLWALYWSIYLLLNSKVRHYLVPLGDGTTREDNITCFIKAEPIEYVRSKLNNFHKNIQFIYIYQNIIYLEVEKESKITFLDVIMIRSKNNIKARAQRKSSNNNVYLNWKSYAPNKSIMGTIRTLTKRVYNIDRQIDKYLEK